MHRSTTLAMATNHMTNNLIEISYLQVITEESFLHIFSGNTHYGSDSHVAFGGGMPDMSCISGISSCMFCHSFYAFVSTTGELSILV